MLLYSTVHHILMKLTVVAPTIRYSVEFLFIFFQRVVGIIRPANNGRFQLPLPQLVSESRISGCHQLGNQFPQLRNISLYSLSDHYVQGF